MSTSSDRIHTLDALRGFAVMGILVMNITVFAMPQVAYLSPIIFTELGDPSQADIISWFLSYVFVEGKMRGIFSFLFGASLLLIIDSALAKGDNPKPIHYRRMLWLAVFGYAHYALLWLGDILFLYATVGCIAYLFHRWEARRLIKWGLIIYALGMVLWGLYYGSTLVLEALANAPNAEAELVEAYKDMMSDPFLSGDYSKELAAHQGDYGAVLGFRMETWYTPLVLVVLVITETLPFMMFGMALKKNGFITGNWESRDYLRWALYLIPAGALITSLFALYLMERDYEILRTLNIFYSWGLVPRLMMTVGYIALLVLAIRRFANSAFISRVCAVGRAAFTNYLGTSVLMSLLFYGYGLGLYGHIERVELWLFVVGTWALMLLWSPLWLANFRYGPLEWLWRSLARGKLQAMRIDSRS